MRFALYSPDRGIVYDGRTPETTGVGGGITARLSLLPALAALGHEVTAYVNCRDEVHHEGVTYVPLETSRRIDADVLIAISTGGALTFAPMRALDVRARMRIVWVQGVPRPADLEVVRADLFVGASRFLRDVIVHRWGIPAEQVVAIYNGIYREKPGLRGPAYHVRGPAYVRDPHAIAYIGPPEKGLASAIEVLRRLRQRDSRYHLDVFGGARLWGRADDETPAEPGVRSMGMLGQAALVPRLFEYEYCLAPQAMEEGFGIGVQEARRAGQIVLASRVGAFAELIRDDYDGFLIDEPHTSRASHERMAELVCTLSIDPARRARLRRRAIVAASAFSWEQAARAFVDLTEWTYTGILVAGYCGHGNLGDEAILQSLLAELRREMPALQVTVASGNPADTSAAHRVDAVHERDLKAIDAVIARSSAVIVGGGGLFHDHFGVDESTLLSSRHWGLTQLATLAAMAERHRKPFGIVGAGVGPLSSEAGQRYTRLIFERASMATVRDARSRELLAEIGVAAERVAVTADPACLLEPSPAADADALLADAAVPTDRKGLIAVALRNWRPGSAWEHAVAAALDQYIDQAGAAVLFIPFQSTSEDPLTDDVAAAQRVRSLMRHHAITSIAESDLSPNEVQRLLASADVVLAMRLHAVVLASMAGTPVVALCYDPKVRVAMAQVGREAAAIDLSALSVTTLLERLCAARSATRGSPEAVGHVRTAASANIAALASMRRETIGPPPASPEWRALVAGSQRRRMRSALRRQVGQLARTCLKRARRFAARHVVTSAARVFDRYKQTRTALYGADLAGLRGDGEPGLVSVVLPVHNGAALVASAIESVLRQTYSNLELVIVNDGSTDGTAAILDLAATSDPRVQVLHLEHQRLPAALSQGFARARGEFLTWTSADNRMKPQCLEMLVGCLQRHPSWDVTYANLDLMDDHGRPWRGSPHYEKYQRPHGSEHVALPARTSELNVVANNFIGAAFLYRRRVAALAGDYSRDRFVLEDYDYWLRANALMTVRHADFSDPVYEYRFHRRSLTSRWEEFDMRRHRDRLMVFDDFRRDFFLSPMVWVIDGPSMTLRASLEARVRAAGHFIHDEAFPLADLPRLSVPVIHVHVTEDASVATAGRTDLPESATRALLTYSRCVSGADHRAADLAIAVGARDCPPGWLIADTVATAFHALDVRAKSRHLARFEAVIERPEPATCKASIVICTREWSDRLDRALDGVAAQQTQHSFEVIVVENTVPHGGRVFRPGGACRTGLNIRRILCPIPGLSAARNAGLAEAVGEIVCFLDDDAVPAPDWLDWMCRAFEEHPRAGVVGGHIKLHVPDAASSAVRPRWRKYWSEFLTQHHEYAEVTEWGRFPYGANWSARRDVLRAVGGFRSRYGRVGNDYGGGEEIVAASLIQRLGARIAVEPRAVVTHHVDPSRFTLSHVLRSMLAVRQVYRRAQGDLYV